MSLKELGLNVYESKTYEMLVKFGKSTASKISKESGVPQSKIYDVLGSLQHKGLTITLPGKVKMFTPSNPEQLIEIINKKKKELEEAEQIAINLKKIYSEEKEPVIVATGKSNFYKINHQMEKPKKYEYNIRFTAEPNPKFLLSAKSHIKQIDFRNMVRYDEETKKNISKWPKNIKEDFKVIENHGIAISIKDDNCVMLGLIKSNTTLLIRDEAFAKLMKELYLEKWKNSKKIND